MATYATKEMFLKYFPKSEIPEHEIDNQLEAASIDIDGLTFNRINACGFDCLTDFQKGIVSRSVCYHTQFKFDNAEMLESIIASYSINGVSVSLDVKKLVTINDVVTSKSVFSILKQSGLCTRRL